MHQALNIKPFAFERVFVPPTASERKASGLEVELEVESLRAELETLRGDHQEALARARSDGFEAGLYQARTERETALLAATDALHASLEAIDEELANATKTITREATELAITAADLMAARALEHAPEQAIDEALSRLLEQLGRGPQLLIKVHSSLAEEMQRIVDVRMARERRRMTLTVIADPKVPIGDAVMLWEHGGLLLDAAARRAAILDELRPLLGD